MEVIGGKKLSITNVLENAHYEIGKERLNYNIIHQIDRDQIPSYELTLDMITVRSRSKKFNVNAISEAEFNK
jgi:predicted nucleic acid-binding protein